VEAIQKKFLKNQRDKKKIKNQSKKELEPSNSLLKKIVLENLSILN
jgi:hypothetical protein